MSTNETHQSNVSTHAKPHHSTSGDHEINDPALPPQRHAGAVGLGPNYPLGPSIGDKLQGMAEEFKGKILKRPELVEHGHDRRTGELMRTERERNNAVDPFKETHGK